MPRLRSSMITTDPGTLVSVDDGGKLVDLPTEEAIENLPNLYEYKRQLQERIKGLKEEIGRKMRVNLDPDPAKVSEVYREIEQARIMDDERMECEEMLLRVRVALRHTENFIEQDEERIRRETE